MMSCPGKAGRGDTRVNRLARTAVPVCLLTVCALTAAAGDVDDPVATSLPAAARSASVQKAAIITVQGEINDVLFKSLRRRVREARQDGVTVIIFELDTPGGLASSALEICKFIKNMTDVKTIAWVNEDAYSAGAMISLACNEVVMAASSSLGDCAPIIFSSDGLKELGKTERAKAESPILKEFRDSAIRNGYDPLLCESMVRLGQEVWWLENVENGERKFVSGRDKENYTADEAGRWRPVERMHDPVLDRDIPIKQPIVEERDLLTLTQTEALAYGFSKAVISSEREIRAHYGITGEMVRLEPNWAEGIADVLSSPVVRTILMILIALGAYAEFHAPGHFVGGAVALIALIIFLGAPYLTGLADAWEILLVGLGVILVAVEVFVIPGFGVAGIAGLLLILVGFVATFVPAEPGPIIVPRMPATWLGLKTGIQVIFGGMALSIAGMWLLNKLLPHLPGARGLLLTPSAPDGAAESSAVPAGYRKTGRGSAPSPAAAVRLGDAGTTLTKLRPSGKARINGRRLDVIAQGQLIEKNRRVEVIEIAGIRIVVREIRQT